MAVVSEIGVYAPDLSDCLQRDRGIKTPIPSTLSPYRLQEALGQYAIVCACTFPHSMLAVLKKLWKGDASQT